MNIHQPVLVEETMNALKIVPNGTYIDGTFGQGGHTKEILNRLGSSGRIVAIDKDPTAAVYVMQAFSEETRFKFWYGSFNQIEACVNRNNLTQLVNGIVLDLGTSAIQLNTPERGFSFLREGPLDMRMNPSHGESAAEWIAKAPIAEMMRVFKEYGEERWSKRIACAIAHKRQTQTIDTTVQLAQIVKDAHLRWPRKIHPATRIFQAIRIHINGEMEALEQCLEQSAKILAPGGRLVVITFHSLEARRVKQFMQHMKSDIATSSMMSWVNKGIKPTRSEILHNPRARSAILRVMEKNV